MTSQPTLCSTHVQKNTFKRNAYCDFPSTFAIWRVHSRKTFTANKSRLSGKNAATCENRSGKIKERTLKLKHGLAI